MSKSDTQNYDQARYAIEALYDRISELETDVEEKKEKINELQGIIDSF